MPTRRWVLAATLASLAARAETGPGAGRDVVVFGDSQAQGLAAALGRAARKAGGPKVQNRARPGTALTNPAVYDWPAELQTYVPDPSVGTAVLMFGGNDHYGMRLPQGVLVPLRTDQFHAIYSARAAAVLASLLKLNLRVFWVGDPICRTDSFSSDMRYLNGIFQEVVAGTPATFVDIFAAVADESGQYAAYGKSLDGAVTRLRLDDGIHFTAAGYDILAAKVNAAIGQAQG